jgi:hypothetical protein
MLQTVACYRRSSVDEELLGRYKVKREEQAFLIEFHLKDDSKDQVFNFPALLDASTKVQEYKY